MRDQSKTPGKRFTRWDSLIPHIPVLGATYSRGGITWPDVLLAQVVRWGDPKLADVALALFDALVMTAHSVES